MNRYSDYRLRQAVGRAKAEILRDVAAGLVPETVASFAELHDHVDANCYGGGTETFDGSDAACAFWNRVQSAVDRWIKRGGLKAAAGR
jgi:hypothetical protein